MYFLAARTAVDEKGVDALFRALKAGATREQREVIKAITSHDLRHDFAQRAREAGWLLVEVTYYLGDVAEPGTQVLRATVSSPQLSREQVKLKLKNIKGEKEPLTRDVE